MSAKQEEYCQSLATQLLTVWQKLGASKHERAAEYAAWGEPKIHALLFTAGKSKTLRTSFGTDTPCDYTSGELKVCIAHLLKVLQGYKDMWHKQWTSERDARQHEADEDARIVAECYTWERATEWLTANSSVYKVEEKFSFVKRIGKTNYYRMRDQAVKLYNHAEAMRLIDSYFPGGDFDSLFGLADDVGMALLYKAKFQFGVKI